MHCLWFGVAQVLYFFQFSCINPSLYSCYFQSYLSVSFFQKSAAFVFRGPYTFLVHTLPKFHSRTCTVYMININTCVYIYIIRYITYQIYIPILYRVIICPHNYHKDISIYIILYTSMIVVQFVRSLYYILRIVSGTTRINQLNICILIIHR